jgi:Pyruvate/2-oxoacid:ferredoxin oxidoreductase gamma subunit
MKHVGRPVPNVPLLGAFAALGGLITLAAVHAAIDQKFKARWHRATWMPPRSLRNRDGTGKKGPTCLNNVKAPMR